MIVDRSKIIRENVAAALREDIGSGDITAQLLPENESISARLICRESARICGTEWVNEVFRQVDDSVSLTWLVSDGDDVAADELLCQITGNARSVLTAERAALNFLQSLSGTATTTREYTALVSDTNTQILDTRKTVPGLRDAQKYAAKIGGAKNHRIGLYDAILIKENHIMAAGSISAALEKAHQIKQDRWVEIEVESLEELDQALTGKPDVIMLDNFSIQDMQQAVAKNNGTCKLEASGNIDKSTLKQVAATGVDYISIGALTKHIRAIDLSLRIDA